MPESFGVITVDGLRGERFGTTQQLALPDGDDSVSTVVQPAQDWQHRKFTKYRVTHESTLRLEGRYQNKPISEVVQVRHFDIYSGPEGLALVRAPKRLWREALNRLQRDRTLGFTFASGELDLARLAPNLGAPIGGAWFGQLKIAKVRTAGIFGPDVAESDEWARYEAAGKLSTLMLEVNFDDHESALMLTSDWTVVLFDDQGEVGNIALVEQVRAAVQQALGTTT